MKIKTKLATTLVENIDVEYKHLDFIEVKKCLNNAIKDLTNNHYHIDYDVDSADCKIVCDNKLTGFFVDIEHYPNNGYLRVSIKKLDRIAYIEK